MSSASNIAPVFLGISLAIAIVIGVPALSPSGTSAATRTNGGIVQNVNGITQTEPWHLPFRQRWLAVVSYLCRTLSLLTDEHSKGIENTKPKTGGET